MSRKHSHSYTMLRAVSATTSQDSSANPTDISYVDKASIHCKFSAANSGSFKVWVRNSIDDTYFELDFGSALTLTSETECNIEMQQLDFQTMYLQWVPSAGSGTLTAILHMASVGA